MKKILLSLLASGVILALGLSNSLAQDEEGGGIFPVEIYTCKYAKGKDAADLDAVSEKWRKWADGREWQGYSAWTMTPFYSSPDQDFDVIWMGTTPTARELGVAQDDWLANGGKLSAEFDSIIPCDSHSNFAVLNFKPPPQNDNPPDNVVISFSDCKIADGKSFGHDVAPSLAAWAKHRGEQGSEAGHWVFFPAYGGGGEEYDFKFVTGHRNHEQQGIDYDNYDADKARELFNGIVECDSSRVYNAKVQRRGSSAE